MEGKHATKRPISATVTSSGNSRTPFTKYIHQAPSSSGPPDKTPPPPTTTTAVEPQAVPRPTAVIPQTRGPRSIAQLRSLNKQEVDALIQGKRGGKPPLKRALSFPGQTSGEAASDEDMQMSQLMRELRQCRYLRTSQEGADSASEEGGDN